MSSTRKTPTTRRILIVDNHPLVRRGLIELIDGEPDLTVCGATESHAAAVAALAATRPDLVITDLSLEAVDDGLGLLKYIRSTYADLPVLVLTMHALPRFADLALQAGARGYITKQEMTETLLIAIRRVLDGERYVHPHISTDQEIH